MKGKILLLSTLMVGSSLYAASALEKKFTADGGYSYGGIGFETIEYKENGTRKSNGDSFSSNAEVSSPVYMTGSFTPINDKFAFSIDAISTLIMNSDTEKWDVNGKLDQINDFESMLSDLKVLVHYNYSSNHKFLIGPKLTNFTAKRHTFKNADGSIRLGKVKDPNGGNVKNSQGTEIGVPVGLSEENVTTLFLNLGYKYENVPFHSNERLRYSVMGLIGKPIWRKASNTSFEQIDFDTTSGYTYEINTYVGYKIFKEVELGVFLEYNFTKKSGANRKNDSNGQSVQWPENDLKVLRTGLMAKWNFN